MFKTDMEDGKTFRLPGDELCAAVERLGIAVAQISLEGKWLLADKELSALSGFSPAELLCKSCFEFLGANLSQDPDYQRLLTGEISVYVRECKASHKNGGTLWVNTGFSLVRDPVSTQPQHLVAVIENVTERQQSEQARREVAERLIKSQEAERARIARELHDEIGQSLAVLAIQMTRAGKPVSGSPGEVHPGPDELCKKVKEITTRVSQISRQLHSSYLEYLGLNAAVQGVCREFGEKYRMKVDCVLDQVPAKVEGFTGLCFLRVLQEALHNIAKHSKAENVEVRLAHVGGELSLVVIDDGTGFEPEEARLAPGLGLISMRERMNLLGGQFDITSGPGEGTLIRATAPITPPK